MAILALLLFIAGFVAWRMRAKAAFPLNQRLAIFQFVAWGAGLVLLLSSMAVVVAPGQAGVQILFGKVEPDVLPSGLHFINPFKQVVEMEVRTRNYTMSGVADEGQKRGDDSIPVITADGLTVKLDSTIFYSLQQDHLAQIYATIGPDVEDRIIRGQIRTSLRDAAASLTATELYTTRRQAFVDMVSKTLKDAFEKRGISMEQVLLRNVLLPEQITKAINDKIAADQEAQKMTFVLQKEKQEAERKRIEAEGQARAQQIVSQSLTPQILEYQRIQALKDIGAHGNLIISGGSGVTPLIQIPSKR
ncbi:MAG TPA: prohibitin family protein [Holophagaceae bacterium]|nr:prohibitin family protein [Holophagaceae bacterium]